MVKHLKSYNLSAFVSKLWTTVKSLSNPWRGDTMTRLKFNLTVEPSWTRRSAEAILAIYTASIGG